MFRTLAAILQGLALPAALGASLGAVGPSYPITEADLLQTIRARLQEKQASGELARALAESARRGSRWMEAPEPVAGLETVAQTRTRYFDPSIVLDRHISDGRGSIMFAAGTRQNPLEIVRLSKALLFFDARDRRQT
jgi:conjugal transfer pilus assembly protein TraW